LIVGRATGQKDLTLLQRRGGRAAFENISKKPWGGEKISDDARSAAAKTRVEKRKWKSLLRVRKKRESKKERLFRASEKVGRNQSNELMAGPRKVKEE